MERIKKALDKGFCTGILLTDLSKAFVCISHDLLIAKLKAYGFSYKSLSLIKNYLSNRYQRIKINNTLIRGLKFYMEFHRALYWDLYYLTFTYVISFYAQKVSIWLIMLMIAPFYNFSGSINEVINKLQNDSRTIIDWYVSNYLKPNSDKWHLRLSYAGNDVRISIDDKEISNSSYEKIHGVYFDNKLNFKTHINKLCKKASQKLHALARMSNFMSCQQKKNIMNAFILSQFSYCPRIWMCHSRSLNSQINKVHERALRNVHHDNNSSFEQRLKLSQFIIEIYNFQLLRYTTH